MQEVRWARHDHQVTAKAQRTQGSIAANQTRDALVNDNNPTVMLPDWRRDAPQRGAMFVGGRLFFLRTPAGAMFLA
ncbi:MAG TPA: hypothetical protein VFV34_10630 [Blastocatellia bacterium]|nr:hypothetical protein [Blastocatellia bacterium]